MEELDKMVREMDDAMRHAEEMKHKIARLLIEEQMTDFLSVNWRRLREQMRRWRK